MKMVKNFHYIWISSEFPNKDLYFNIKSLESYCLNDPTLPVESELNNLLNTSFPPKLEQQLEEQQSYCSTELVGSNCPIYSNYQWFDPTNYNNSEMYQELFVSNDQYSDNVPIEMLPTNNCYNVEWRV